MPKAVRVVESHGESWCELAVIVFQGQDADVDGGLGHLPVLEDGNELEDGSVIGGSSLYLRQVLGKN